MGSDGECAVAVSLAQNSRAPLVSLRVKVEPSSPRERAIELDETLLQGVQAK